MLAAKNPARVNATALLAPTLWLNGWMMPRYARLFKLIRYKWFANLFTFRHHDPHGIKDERIREFISKGTNVPGCLGSRPSRAAGRRRLRAPPFGQGDAKAGPICAPARPDLASFFEDDYAALKNATCLRDSLKGPIEMMVLEDCYHVMTRRSAAPPRSPRRSTHSSEISSETSPATLLRTGFPPAIRRHEAQ